MSIIDQKTDNFNIECIIIDDCGTDNSMNVVYDIIGKIVKEIEYRLRDKKISLLITDKAKQFIVDSAYNEQYGARPIKRFISKNVENLLARKIIEGEVKFNSVITIDVSNNEIILK